MDSAAVVTRLCAGGAAALCLVMASTATAQPAPAGETVEAAASTFLTGPALAEKLMKNVVRIRTTAIGEAQHGHGFIVSWDSDWLYVLTARHVVAFEDAVDKKTVPAVEVDLCASPGESPPHAEILPFDASGEDAAMLRVKRPARFIPEVRALAAIGAVRAGQESWVLGNDGECRVAPGVGRIGSPPDQRGIFISLHPGIRGGSSGAPLMTGAGIAGIVFDSDQMRVDVVGLAVLMQGLRVAGITPGLQAAGNVPPGDPRAARIDLSETLNQYLFAARNVHGLLLQRTVPEQNFTEYVEQYNVAIRRFRDAREKYDGSLSQTGALPQWQQLRDKLWAIHLAFWKVNEASETIVRDKKTPLEVKERLRALDPSLTSFERDIAEFLKVLETGSLQ